MALKSIVCWSIVALVLVPFTASAQQAGGIAGVVRDTSGGVLPGATVDAASPVLIEQVRTVFTNGEGRYSIVDLRPGLYTVTFTLPGFSTVIREGVELTTGFTAAVNVDLQVGTLEETITVTGATPLVDVQNVRRQEVVSNELLEALPTSTKNLTNLVTLTAGFTGLSDVGGRYTTQVGGNFHGKSGTKVNFDGMGIENTTGANSYQVHAGVIEEMVLSTSGISAETNADGPVINVIPKEGGNTFSGTLAGFLANDKLESSNLTSELRSQGLTTSNITTKTLGRVGERRRAAQAGQTVVLCHRSELGLHAGARRRLLEQDAGYVPHAAGGGAQGRVVHARYRSAAGPIEWAMGVVRLVPDPDHVAGGGQAQAQFYLRRATWL